MCIPCPWAANDGRGGVAPIFRGLVGGR